MANFLLLEQLFEATTSLQDVNTDQVGVTDQEEINVDVGRSDTVTVADSRAILSSPDRSDGVGVTDSRTTVTSFVITVSDSVGVTETEATDVVITRSDSVGITRTTGLDAGVARSDAESLTDSVLSVKTATLDVTDSMNVTDSRVTATGENDVDGVTISDLVSMDVSRPLLDALALTDAVSVVRILETDVVDVIGATDSFQAFIEHTLDISDVMSVVDAFDPLGTILISQLTSVARVSDTFNMVLDTFLTVNVRRPKVNISSNRSGVNC